MKTDGSSKRYKKFKRYLTTRFHVSIYRVIQLFLLGRATPCNVYTLSTYISADRMYISTTFKPWKLQKVQKKNSCNALPGSLRNIQFLPMLIFTESSKWRRLRRLHSIRARVTYIIYAHGPHEYRLFHYSEPIFIHRFDRELRNT